MQLVVGPAILSKAYIVYGHRGFVRGVLDRFKLRTMRHHFWGVALLGIFLVSCGSNSPKPEEPKSSILPAPPTPEAPALKKAELGPEPDLGSVIILEVPAEGTQSFYVKGEPGARYLAKVIPLYGSSKTKKKNAVVSSEQAPAGKSKDPKASSEPPKLPQGFTATLFPVVEAPSLPGNFYTAATLKGLKEGRYQLPAAAPPIEAAQATETQASSSTVSTDEIPEKSSAPPSLPESLWSPVTDKGTEAFEVKTEVLPSGQATQPVVLEVKNLDAVPRTVQVVIRERKP
jgi:hypothetical protein